MSSNPPGGAADTAITIDRVSKRYQLYKQPTDRILQALHNRISAVTNKERRVLYEEVVALEDMSLTVNKGETLGVVGRNGSGKSTLLQLVAGTLAPSTGQVRTHGRVAAILELGSGFNSEFTGRENALLSAQIYGLDATLASRRLASIAEFADIGAFFDRPVKTYSSGMVVRLAFAVIAHVDADILIIDEALAVGDAFFAQKCMRFLRAFKARGTILFVSHDTQAVQGLCSRAALLQGGRLAAVGEPSEISKLYLEQLYGQARRTNAAATTSRDNDTDEHTTAHAVAERAGAIAFRFNEASSGFGAGGAEIVAVRVLKDGEQVSIVHGAEQVSLEIAIRANRPLENVIVGFTVKDRLGQALFGDNTYLTYVDKPPTVDVGKMIRARFDFQMPLLPSGDYVIAAAIATGTQEDHIQQHWLHEAALLRSNCQLVATGLVGVPMKRIEVVAR